MYYVEFKGPWDNVWVRANSEPMPKRRAQRLRRDIESFHTVTARIVPAGR